MLIEFERAGLHNTAPFLEDLEPWRRARCQEDTGSAPEQVLADSLDRARPSARVAYFDGNPAMLFGAEPHPDYPNVGAPWLWTTKFGRLHPRGIVTVSRAAREWLLRTYPSLLFYVDLDSPRALAYARWWGGKRVRDLPDVNKAEFILP